MARGFSYSCSPSGGVVKTGAFGAPSTRGYIKVTGCSFNESTGQVTVSYDYGMTQDLAGGCAVFSAVAVAFGGTVYDSGKWNSNGSSSYIDNTMAHGEGAVNAGKGSRLYYNVSLSAGQLYKTNSGSLTFSTQGPLSFGVKAQMNGGWGWENRWNSGSYVYENKTGGSLSFTFPQYDITYNANGGSGAPNGQTKNYFSNLTLQSGKPTRTGYTFIGWATSSTATTAEYSPGSTFKTNKSTTLYAVWSINAYKLDVNGLLDNNSVGNTTNYGTFSIDINGVNRHNNITDFYEDVTYNQTYKIYNIKPLIGHTYKGNAVYEGKMPASAHSIQLPFVTNDIKVKTNNEWKPGDVYIKKNGAWVRPTAVYIKQNGAWQKIDG